MKSSHETLIIRTKGELIEETTDQVASEIGFTLNVNEKTDRHTALYSD